VTVRRQQVLASKGIKQGHHHGPEGNFFMFVAGREKRGEKEKREEKKEKRGKKVFKRF
jgi:hypothetical protein